MKYLYLAVLLIILLLPVSTFGQATKDYTVLVSAIVKKDPAQIILKWPSDANATSYKIYRKAKTDNSWGAAKATLPSGSTGYTDNSVSVGQAYEYKIEKTAANYKGYGYIYAGIEMPLNDLPGKVLLLVEESIADDITDEIHRLKNDMAGDGWAVKILYISNALKVTEVKDIIKNEHKRDPLKAVFILGHIAVPYSGNYAPDHHIPDHQGAWPADVFYADVADDDKWTDFVVDSDIASRSENENVPGDMKYDQDVLPSDIELQVGRVDLGKFTLFSESEPELIKRYLDKNHAWRNAQWDVKYKGVIEDNFGGMGGEAFAASAYNGFSAMFGDTNIMVADYFTTLTQDSLIWSHGNGGGSYTSAGGIGKTGDFVDSNINSVFTMLFGSYFGDWDVQNSFLRAPLAARGMVLANVWSGRPQFSFHHMALGENIGYSTWLSQNDYKNYYRIKRELFFPLQLETDRLVTPALMGDPTLRMYVVSPPKLTAQRSGNKIDLKWQRSADKNITAYYVYRTTSDVERPFDRIAVKTPNDTAFTDDAPLNLSGRNYYMVRAVKLQVTGSGSFFNLSTGSIDSVGNPSAIEKHSVRETSISLYPNPANTQINIQLPENTKGNIKITVSDALGKIYILQHAYINDAQNASVQLNISWLPSGVYILQFNGSNSFAAESFVKN